MLGFLFIVIGVATPGFQQIRNSINRSNTQLLLLQDLRKAQAHTVTEGCRGIVRIASNQRSYSFGCDYIPYSAANPPLPDSVVFLRYLPSSITIASSGPIIFNSRGQTVDVNNNLTNTTITLLLDSGSGSPSLFATGILRATGFFSFS
ncbi:MAG TPA: hypothetical protein PKD37_00805 [Oligoflexia bacterium]|nr:hypothetical protein [Oligoflexia bacterium]HMP26519.1 hypothetical protein [Oligoflexia bacterium]